MHACMCVRVCVCVCQCVCVCESVQEIHMGMSVYGYIHVCTYL